MSSRITQEKYDPVKIERLKHFLESSVEKGQPRFYEVYVDNLKVVSKTCDPAQFDEYETYMGADTRMVKVLIYTGNELSPRNDKFIYVLSHPGQEREEQQRQELSGLRVEERIDALLEKERDKHQIQLLQEKLRQAEEEVDELNGFNEELQEKVRHLQSSRVVQKENIGELVSLALENMLRRNAHLLSGIPMIGQGLAGVMQQEAQRQQTAVGTSAPADRLTTFTVERIRESEESGDNMKSLTKEQEEIMTYFEAMKQRFSQSELDQIFYIIGALSHQPKSIPTIVQLLDSAVSKMNPQNAVKKAA